MAFTNLAGFPVTIQTWAQQILPADTTTKKTLVTAGANGSIVEAIMMTNTDTVAYGVQLFINDGSTDHLIGTVNLPISAGNTTAAPSLDLLRNGSTPFMPGVVYDSNGNPVMFLKGGYILKIASLTTVTAAKVIDCVAMGCDY